MVLGLGQPAPFPELGKNRPMMPKEEEAFGDTEASWEQRSLPKHRLPAMKPPPPSGTVGRGGYLKEFSE